MNGVRFGSPQPPVSRSLDQKLAEGVFEAPGKVQNWIDRTVSKPVPGSQNSLNPLQKAKNIGVKTGGGLAKMLVDYDYRSFAGLGKVMLSEPPKGALLLLLYPGTVGPRVYRAYQRGKENKDYREVWDILRRDMTGISLFVFALAPIVKGLSMFTEWKTSMKLLDPKTGNVLKYSDFKNCNIDNLKVLQALLNEGNGPALQKAVNGLTDSGLKDKHGYTELAPILEKLKKSVNKLVDQFKPDTKGHAFSSEMRDLADAAFKNFNAAEDNVKEIIGKAAKDQNSGALKIAKKLPGEFKGVLKNFANARRLPADVISFAMVVGLIGYFPVWFNTQWNKNQYEKKNAQAKKLANNEPAPPAKQSNPPALAGMPQLPLRPLQSMQWAAARPANRPAPFQSQALYRPMGSPFMMPIQPGNPFLRQ